MLGRFFVRHCRVAHQDAHSRWKKRERSKKEEAREATTSKAVVIIVLRSDCSSTCELSVRISAALRTVERGNIPRRTLTATTLAWPREGTQARGTSQTIYRLEIYIQSSEFYRPPTKNGDSLTPRSPSSSL